MDDKSRLTLKDNDLSRRRLSNFYIPLISGAMAGMSVDLTLYPIDTLKTRIQSSDGFWKSGGFRRIYSGLISVMVGSAPNAALFFCAYESSKSSLNSVVSQKYQSFNHMISASIGEVTACLVRVPTEVIKQRAQASKASSLVVLKKTLANEGFPGLYRGYMSTIAREIPFSLIQFPLWEYLKKEWSDRQKSPINPLQATACGALSGGLSALLTTPLDLAKTRIILAEKGNALSFNSIYIVLKQIYRKNGFFGLFSGGVPRVIQISIGGAIFLGGYHTFSTFLKNHFLI